MAELTREDLARLRTRANPPFLGAHVVRLTIPTHQVLALIALAERVLDLEEGETRVETMWRRKSDGEQLKSPTYNKRASEPYKRTVTYGPWRAVEDAE